MNKKADHPSYFHQLVIRREKEITERTNTCLIIIFKFIMIAA